jgi:ABC-type oligopeptide transport system ATPase subunit
MSRVISSEKNQPEAALLKVRNLRKYYPVRENLFGSKGRVVKAVDGISFSIRRGETLGLVGESGSGKTTTGRCILRLIEPTGGEIELLGFDLLKSSKKELHKIRRNVQAIFQDPFGSLNPRFTVSSIIEEPLLVHHIGMKKDRIDRVNELLNMVGLDPNCRNRYPHEFSGGQRQRIGIARALALQPEIIIADEPVSSLDVSVQAQIINLLQDLQQKLHLTFLFIAHDLAVVQHFCDRIAVMYRGKIVEMASSMDLFREPLHPYTRNLLASIPIPDPDQRKKREFPDGDLFSQGNREEPELREVRPNHWVAERRDHD